MSTPASTARVLIEALPYIQRFAGQTVVIKYGGNALSGTEHADPLDVFAQDIVMLRAVGIRPVVVHGGGPQINAMLDRLGVKSEFRDGRRVTDEATMQVVRMVLTGEVNPSIVSAISARGGRAVGLSGADDGMISVVQRDPELGFVGDVTGVRTAVLEQLLDDGCIPVIATIGVDVAGQTYNINADSVAAAVAGALGAAKLLYLTDIEGLRRNVNDAASLISKLTADELRSLLGDGTIAGGMIPKAESCLEAVELGVPAVHILDGRVAHVTIIELFTDAGIGTMVTGVERG
ncbi:MAG: acetylglutamate kinase [Actinobacteria bacterium]|nr:acetylglutamate kinase [Actinomycetota bacterium]NBP54017.1 acetylglutamate kinase [Actinomycetota bacterium]